MFKKITITAVFTALMAFAQYRIGIVHANDVNNAIRGVNQLSEEIESQYQNPQTIAGSYTQDGIDK